MDIKTVHLRVFVLTFMLNVYSAAGGTTDGDILSSVLYELSHLKYQATVSARKLTELDHRILTCESQLKSAEFSDSKDRILAAENKLKTTEKRLAEAETRLVLAETKLETSEKLYAKLYEMEKRLHAAESKVAEKLYNKLHHTEKRLHAAETKLKTVKPFHCKELPEKETEILATEDQNGNKDESAKVKFDGYNTELSKTLGVINSSIANTVGRVKTGTVPREMHVTVTDKKAETRVPVAPVSKRLLGSVVSHRVAFTAYLSDHVSGLGKAQTIPFDQVLLNEGQAFDTVLHVFICPVNGIYMFQAALVCERNHYIQTEMVKDGSPLVRMYADGAATGDGFDQGTNSAVIQCNKGERVWIRVHNSWGTAVFSWQYSSFSGYILWEK